MPAHQVEQQLCINRIVLGAARLEGAAVTDRSLRVDRAQDQAAAPQQGVDQRHLARLDADRDLLPRKTLLQCYRPVVDGSGTVRQNAVLQCLGTGHAQVQVVFSIGLVDANDGGEMVKCVHGMASGCYSLREIGNPISAKAF